MLLVLVGVSSPTLLYPEIPYGKHSKYTVHIRTALT